ncbi:fumarylacetoacetate hydrolase family protein [Rathayibacter soli]|uniref:fumarylacetoacetate hydrolase family protein n=1 Tax=Rathayibacter soli TaxID=3144168 RepID=UPI0027E46D4D|nr:fumarylacetoacetate hydrolase family protein [Glaciibacter superstes]
MRLLTFTREGSGPHVGALLTDETLLDLTQAAAGDPVFSSLLSLIDSGDSGIARAQNLLSSHEFDEHALPIGAVRVLAPIPRPRKNVYCVGLNFRSHVEQNAAALGEQAQIPEVPLFFSKPVTAVIGPGDAIVLDERLTTKLDYEVELAIVIGRRGKWISAADAPSHIFGYTIANDVSARDLQWRTSQFLYGKGQDTYCPLGPIIRTADEVDVSSLTLDLLVNDDLRQSESAGNMLFSPQEVVGWLSQGITLEPGDIITLGTPGGCGYQLSPPQYLQSGDVVECRITSLGSLVNRVENA